MTNDKPLLGLLVWPIAATFWALIIWWLWNESLVPAVPAVREITFLQAAGIHILYQTLKSAVKVKITP